MRDILFRGKRVDNGEWIHGYYIKATHHWHKHGRHEDWIATDTVQNGGWCNVRGKYAVIPETVGQYTGLTDKNGKKIFEGDILSFSDRLVYVNWHDYCGCWDCSYIKAVDGEATLREDRGPNKWRYNAVVVGNICDNPELLKEGGQRC